LKTLNDDLVLVSVVYSRSPGPCETMWVCSGKCCVYVCVYV